MPFVDFISRNILIQVQVRRNLDGLVSQLTRDNADLNDKNSKLEEEMRALLNQSLISFFGVVIDVKK